MLDFFQIAHVVPALRVELAFLQILPQQVVDPDHFIRHLGRGNWGAIVENGPVDVFVELFHLLGAVSIAFELSADGEESGYFEQIIYLLVGDVVLDHDGFIVPGKLFILLDLLHDFWQLLEFVVLCGFECFWVEGADVVDLCEFALEELEFVENDFEDRVTVFFLGEDGVDLGLLRQFYYKAAAYLNSYKG
jgi:hypothetical protein